MESEMKATGARSISVYLLVALNIFWYVVAIVLVAAGVILGLSFIRNIHGLAVTALPPSFEVNQGDVGGRLTIPVSLALEDDRGVAAPALGIKTAEIRDLRGNLRFPARGDR